MSRSPGAAARMLAVSAALAVAGSASFASAATSPAPGPRPVSVLPSRISAGLFHDGATIFVHGAVEEGSQVAVRIVGPTESRRFNRRGKIAGIIWGGVGQVTFRDAPSLYALFTSAPLDGLAPRPLREQLRLGYDCFASGIVVEGTGATDRALVGELIQLKESEGLYRNAPGTIELAPPADGARAYHVTVPVPASASPGAIEVTVLELRDGAVVRSDVQRVHVERVGIPAALLRLARERGTVFGLLSVFVLLLTGFAVELVRGGVRAVLQQTGRHESPEAQAQADTGGKGAGS